MFKIGDVVYVSNPDKLYEESELPKRTHKSFFGKIVEIDEYSGFNAIGVEFFVTPNSYKDMWYYKDSELSLASDLNNMTLGEFIEKFGVDIYAEFKEGV